MTTRWPCIVVTLLCCMLVAAFATGGVGDSPPSPNSLPNLAVF